MGCGGDPQPIRRSLSPATDHTHAEAHAVSAPTSAPSGGGLADPAPEPADDGPRLTSIRYKTWVWPTPNAQGRYLGYIRVGQSVRLRSAEPVPGQLCKKGFYAIE